ncbi:MAG: hypothetical protein NDJ90_09065 [Oligoflexia bacterium]|nr:hypothetical protein [Oligoflexia bacterium]
MNQKADAVESGKRAEEQIAVHGFQQVLEMLRIADPAFRESLLRRLAARDIQLAKTLRSDLAALEL